MSSEPGFGDVPVEQIPTRIVEKVDARSDGTR